MGKDTLQRSTHSKKSLNVRHLITTLINIIKNLKCLYNYHLTNSNLD